MSQEFQRDKPRSLSADLIARVRRDLPQKAVHTYRGVGAGDNEQENFLRIMRRQSDFIQITTAYSTVTQLVLPAANRTYFLIQNLDTVAFLFVGFGFQPDGPNGIGLKLVPGGFYEPFQVPQNDVFIAGSAVGAATIIYAGN